MGKVTYKEISKELLKMSTPLDNTGEGVRSSLNAKIEVIEHYKIDIEKLIPYKNQARKEFDQSEIENLASSIKEHGIRQPLTIIQSLEYTDKYEVVSGERRLRAAKIVGLKKIPCILISDYMLADEIALVENIQRQDLHPIELGEAFQKILNSHTDMNQVTLSEKLGISNKTISETLQYAKLPDHIKSMVISKKIINRDFLRKLLKSTNPESLLTDKNFENKDVKDNINSVIRISLIDGEYHLQSNNIKKLSDEKKNILKSLLSELINNI